MSLLVWFAGLGEIFMDVYFMGKTLLLKVFPKTETSFKIFGGLFVQLHLINLDCIFSPFVTLL